MAKIRCHLAEILARRNTTLRELEDKTKLNYSHLSDIKRERKIPNLDTAFKIAEALGLSVDDIWTKK